MKDNHSFDIKIDVKFKHLEKIYIQTIVDR